MKLEQDFQKFVDNVSHPTIAVPNYPFIVRRSLYPGSVARLVPLCSTYRGFYDQVFMQHCLLFSLRCLLDVSRARFHKARTISISSIPYLNFTAGFRPSHPTAQPFIHNSAHPNLLSYFIFNHFIGTPKLSHPTLPFHITPILILWYVNSQRSC